MPSPPRLCSGSAEVTTAQVLTFCLTATCFLKASSRPTCPKIASRASYPSLPQFLSDGALWCMATSMLSKMYWAEGRGDKMADPDGHTETPACW